MGSVARTTGTFTAPYTQADMTDLRTRVTSNAIMYRADILAIKNALYGVGHLHTYFDQVTKYDTGNKDGGSSSTTRNSSTTNPAVANFTLSTTCYASEVNAMMGVARGFKNHTHTIDDYY